MDRIEKLAWHLLNLLEESRSHANQFQAAAGKHGLHVVAGSLLHGSGLVVFFFPSADMF